MLNGCWDYSPDFLPGIDDFLWLGPIVAGDLHRY